MKPYRSNHWALFHPREKAITLLFLAFSLVTSAAGAGRPVAPIEAIAAKLTLDSATRAGSEYFYNMEYDKAISSYEKVAQAHPNDPFAVNHLLTAVLFKELYRIGALDSELYAKNNFLDSKHLPVDPNTSKRIKELMDRALALTQARQAADPNDADALYARGVTYGSKALYMGLVDKAWFPALRAALAARRDHERVLELNPGYTDAEFLVGVHNYVIGSVSWGVKVAAAVVGISGSKKKGIQQLYDAANHGTETTADAKIALSMFLRREQRYPEAISLIGSLVQEYPRNFLIALEHANLLNAAGKGPEAIAAYHHLLSVGHTGAYYEPRLGQAAYGLAEALRGQHDFQGAAEAYEQVQTYKSVDPELRDRANLAAGEMYDLLEQRDSAVERYKAVIAADGDSWRAEIARKRLKTAYKLPKG